jgi:hypothetical protein
MMVDMPSDLFFSLRNHPGMKMIYDHPIRSIISNWKTDRLPDWMRYVLHQIMVREETLQKTPEEIFRESVEETQKN